jgi:hypothetical protein
MMIERTSLPRVEIHPEFDGGRARQRLSVARGTIAAVEPRRDSDRTRWLILLAAWAIAAFVLLSDARTVRDYLALTGSLGLRGEVEATTPLRQTYPEFAADAQTWVLHALSLIEGDGIRLRHTTIDNAPAGRDVHWNSAWAWAIAAAGGVHHLATGTPIAHAVEKATLWLNAFVLLALIIAFSAWTLRRMGLLAAIFIVAAMTLHERILEGFFPGYVDHHGLLAASVLGTVLGAVAMVGGWGARQGAIFSALCGAVGLWVSAASVVPAIAFVGLAGALCASEAGAWRTWGRVGAAASFLFYLLEYFPSHMGMRLEVNHPLYALAWWGGGELVAQVKERRLRPLGPAAALLAIPVAIAAGGASVLSFIDPFMARLHADYIKEFLPLWVTLPASTGGMMWRVAVLEAAPLAAALATLAIRRRESPPVVVFATLVVAPLLAMAWWQGRWQINASAASICLALVLVRHWTQTIVPGTIVSKWLIAALVVAVLYLPGGYVRYHSAANALATRHVGFLEAAYPLARDVAAALRASQPRGDIVMLASPNASTMVGYYGRFRTLGTLYWENAAGLKAAASIFSARDDAEAARLAREHGVTHVAMISQENFVAEYYDLLHPRATAAEVQASFGARLLAGNWAPAWLERIPYEKPAELRGVPTQVLLFKVK